MVQTKVEEGTFDERLRRWCVGTGVGGMTRRGDSVGGLYYELYWLAPEPGSLAWIALYPFQDRFGVQYGRLTDGETVRRVPAHARAREPLVWYRNAVLEATLASCKAAADQALGVRAQQLPLR